MISLLEAVFLGVVQGLTEWLPISSSGHLVIAQQLLGMQVPLLFDVLLHTGTLVALFVFFCKDIWKALSALLRFDFKSADGKIALFVLIGTVPIVLAGLFFYNLVVPIFNSIFAVGVALIITGFILYLTKFFKNSGGLNRNLGGLDVKNALFIGISQAISLVPGISRSGITISSALFRKVDRQKAFVFSFLLAIPAIIGANIFELYRTAGLKTAALNLDIISLNIIGLDIISFEMIIGAAVAAVIGYFSLKFLQGVLKKGNFYLFAYYCWVVGAALLIYTYFL